jgi:alpha-glucosidase
MIGGEINFLYFLGEKPEESIKLYHKFIDGFLPPPFWALGYH